MKERYQLQHLPNELYDLILSFIGGQIHLIMKFRTICRRCQLYIDEESFVWNSIPTFTLRSPYANDQIHYNSKETGLYLSTLVVPLKQRYLDHSNDSGVGGHYPFVQVTFERSKPQPASLLEQRRTRAKEIKESIFHNLLFFTKRWKRRYFLEKLFYNKFIAFGFKFHHLYLLEFLFYLTIFLIEILPYPIPVYDHNRRDSPESTLFHRYYLGWNQKQSIVKNTRIIQFLFLFLIYMINVYFTRSGKKIPSTKSLVLVGLQGILTLFLREPHVALSLVPLANPLNQFLLTRFGWDGYLCIISMFGALFNHLFITSIFSLLTYFTDNEIATMFRDISYRERRNLISFLLTLNPHYINREKNSSRMELLLGLFSQSKTVLVEALIWIFVFMFFYNFVYRIALYLSGNSLLFDHMSIT